MRSVASSEVGSSSLRRKAAQGNLAATYGDHANVFNAHLNGDGGIVIPPPPLPPRPDIDSLNGQVAPIDDHQLAISIPNSPPSVNPMKYASPGSEKKSYSSAIALINVKQFDKVSSYLNEPFLNTKKTRWETLDANEKSKILKLFRKKDRKGKALYFFVLSCAFGSLVGELFYLTFDYRARVDTLAPLIPTALNYTVNGLVQPFIGCANFTFEPFDEANGILTKRLLKQSFGIYDSQHRVASLAISASFFTFALSGGYVEIIGISDLLSLMPIPAQVSIIFTLMFMAISYYFLFNFLDMIGNNKVWLDQDSVLKRMVSRNRPMEERLIDLYAALCESATNTERVIRMALGLFFAGLALGIDVAYTFAVFAALCTLPVSIGTRGYTARSLFSPEITADNLLRKKTISNTQEFMDRYAITKNEYQENREKGWKEWCWAELQLIFSPFMWLQLALVVFTSVNLVPAASSEDEATNDAERTAAVLGVIFMYALTQYLARFPNLREHLITETVKHFDAKKPSALNNKGENLATISSLLDSSSRVITFVFGLQLMVPGNAFDIGTTDGLLHSFYAACGASWIAANPYHYQKNRVRGAISQLPVPYIKQASPQQVVVLEDDEPEAKAGGILSSCSNSISSCWTSTKDKASNCWATTFSGRKVDNKELNKSFIDNSLPGSDGNEADDESSYVPPPSSSIKGPGAGYSIEDI